MVKPALHEYYEADIEILLLSVPGTMFCSCDSVQVHTLSVNDAVLAFLLLIQHLEC